MSVVAAAALEPIVDDPDDYRPQSRWRLVTDPDARVDITVILEEIAPGDRIPLHRHQIDEAIVVVSGAGTARLEDTRTPIAAGSCVFIPAGTPHGTVNDGREPLVVHAIFPTPLIDMEMLERNPAPGTEGKPPAHVVYDARTGAFFDYVAPEAWAHALGEVQFAWRADASDGELVALTLSYGGNAEAGWWDRIRPHSLGWVTARLAGELVGFVNVAWDGGDHAFLIDTKVRPDHQRRGIGTELVRIAARHAKEAGCEWLEVDFDEHLEPFYYDACGFTPARAGLMRLPDLQPS